MCVTARHVPVKVTAEEYLPALGSQLSLHFIASLHADGQSVSAIKVVNLKTKDLYMAVTHTHTPFYRP